VLEYRAQVGELASGDQDQPLARRLEAAQRLERGRIDRPSRAKVPS
jgi:hypothetical protein